jgi:hypothetical protein
MISLDWDFTVLCSIVSKVWGILICTVLQTFGVLSPSYDFHYTDRFLIRNQTKDPLNGKSVHCSIQSPLPSLIGKIIMLSILDYTICYKKLNLTLWTEGVKVLLLLLLLLWGWYATHQDGKWMNMWHWWKNNGHGEHWNTQKNTSPSSILFTKYPAQIVLQSHHSLYDDVDISLGYYQFHRWWPLLWLHCAHDISKE